MEQGEHDRSHREASVELDDRPQTEVSFVLELEGVDAAGSDVAFGVGGLGQLEGRPEKRVLDAAPAGDAPPVVELADVPAVDAGRRDLEAEDAQQGDCAVAVDVELDGVVASPRQPGLEDRPAARRQAWKRRRPGSFVVDAYATAPAGAPAGLERGLALPERGPVRDERVHAAHHPFAVGQLFGREHVDMAAERRRPQAFPIADAGGEGLVVDVGRSRGVGADETRAEVRCETGALLVVPPGVESRLRQPSEGRRFRELSPGRGPGRVSWFVRLRRCPAGVSAEGQAPEARDASRGLDTRASGLFATDVRVEEDPAHRVEAPACRTPSMNDSESPARRRASGSKRRPLARLAPKGKGTARV